MTNGTPPTLKIVDNAGTRKAMKIKALAMEIKEEYNLLAIHGRKLKLLLEELQELT